MVRSLVGGSASSFPGRNNVMLSRRRAEASLVDERYRRSTNEFVKQKFSGSSRDWDILKSNGSL